MKMVCIVQARMGSSRLPGKVAMDILGKTMLERVIDRALAIDHIDQVVVATSSKPADQRVASLAQKLGVPCFRGSESDVLDRYYQTAEAYRANAVVRITADCPLLDPQISSLVVRRFLEIRPDYCANTLERTFPRGLDTEVVSIQALETSHREATESPDREHVTRFIWRQPQKFTLLSVRGSDDNSNHRWTVDTPEDLEFVKKIYRHILNTPHGERAFHGSDKILALLHKHPDWVDINASIEQKSV